MEKTEIEQIAEEVMEEHGQSEEFKNRFIKFYENTINNNLGGTSLEKLIENVNLPEEDKIDES